MFIFVLTANNWWPTDFFFFFPYTHFIAGCLQVWLKQSSCCLLKRSQVSLHVTGACIPAKSLGVKSLSRSPLHFFIFLPSPPRSFIGCSPPRFLLLVDASLPLLVDIDCGIKDLYWRGLLEPSGQLTVTEAPADVCWGSRISSKRSR